MSRISLPIRILAALFLGLLIWVGAAALLLSSHPRASDIPYDAIVVLGCGINDDGSLSATLRARVDHAIALHREGVAPVILFTGGRNQNGDTESLAAEAYAQSWGCHPRCCVSRPGATPHGRTP